MLSFHELQHHSLLTMPLKMVYFLVLLIYAQGNVEALRSDNTLLVNQDNAAEYPLKVIQISDKSEPRLMYRDIQYLGFMLWPLGIIWLAFSFVMPLINGAYILGFLVVIAGTLLASEVGYFSGRSFDSLYTFNHITKKLQSFLSTQAFIDELSEEVNAAILDFTTKYESNENKTSRRRLL